MKGYWIARIDVTDEEVYPEYGKRAMPAIAKYGGRLIVRGGRGLFRHVGRGGSVSDRKSFRR